MKFKNKKWWKAMAIRGWKTFYQSLIAGGIGTLVTGEWKVALATAVLTAVFSCINSAIVKLPEVEPTPSKEVSPIIEDEVIIDTSEDDELLEGNVLGNLERSDQ